MRAAATTTTTPSISAVADTAAGLIADRVAWFRCLPPGARSSSSTTAWNALFANHASSPDADDRGGPPVLPLASAVSFFEPAAPAASVHVGRSFSAAHWLRTQPRCPGSSTSARPPAGPRRPGVAGRRRLDGVPRRAGGRPGAGRESAGPDGRDRPGVGRRHRPAPAARDVESRAGDGRRGRPGPRRRRPLLPVYMRTPARPARRSSASSGAVGRRGRRLLLAPD